MATRVFVNREKELEYLNRWVESFPPPSTSVSRRRDLLFIIGPKGVGKSALLRKYAERSKDTDRIVVYIEFREAYTSPEDLINDVVSQYYEALNQYTSLKNKLIRVLAEVVGVLVEKSTGLSINEIIKALRSPKHSVSPSVILRNIERRLAETICKQNKKLVIIYDEFQNYVKSIVHEPSRYPIMVEVLLNSLSKIQEWGYGFNDNAYSIFILSSSDYTVYKLISRSSVYQVIHVYSLNELTLHDSIKLLEELGRSYGVEFTSEALEYVVKVLGGNPAILISFTSKLKELNYKLVGLEEAEEALSLLVEEEARRLIHLNLEHDVCIIHRILGENMCMKTEELENMVAEELKDASLKPFMRARALEEARRFLESLLRVNILTWGSGYYCLQNRLVRQALDKLCSRY